MKPLKEECLELEGMKIVLQYKAVRNISLKVSPDRLVLVSLPYNGAKEKALAFVREKSKWLQKHIQELEKQTAFSPDQGFDGKYVWLWGSCYIVNFQPACGNEQVLLKDNTILFTYRGNLTIKKQAMLVEKFYISCIGQMIEVYLAKWQPKLNLYAHSWKLARLKSKWGRCNITTKELLFNVSLVHRPVICLEYVVLHELAHLYEASHNARFKLFLSRYMSDWQQRRNILNKYIFTID